MKQHIWRIAGMNFAHMHMGDNLRMAWEHPNAEIVGVCDEQLEKTAVAADNFNLRPISRYTDFRECMEKTTAPISSSCVPLQFYPGS